MITTTIEVCIFEHFGGLWCNFKVRSVGRIKLLVSVVVKFSPNQVLNLCNGHFMDRSERKTHFL